MQKGPQNKKPLVDKKEHKNKQREAVVYKMASIPVQPQDIVEMIKLNKPSTEKYQGEKVQVSTCGSKPVASYVAKTVLLLESHKEVMLFGYDKALSKLVTTV